ncbi:MAG: glycosyl transferase family A [Moraxellaceae bacterium]|nr:MAG: glycosyl transferase family A [Moraxellaceae bacterium]
MLISFIIPHKGREELLALTVKSILEQDYPHSEMEVVIVTQNKTLTDPAISSTPSLSIKHVFRPENETISTLRNIGTTHASGQYFAFLDADIELSPNWVQSMTSELQSDSSRVLVSAVQRCTEDAPALEKIRTALSNAAIDCNVRFLPGRNLLLDKSTFTSAGGFPEHLVTCEDYYFTDKVHALGHLYYSSKANYIHLGEDKLYNEMFHKEIWRGQSNLQSIKGRPIPLSELPSFLVPVWVLLFFLVTVIGLLTQHVDVALMGLGITLLPIVIYSIRLHSIASGKVRFIDILKFYITYFPARIIGTISGLFKVIHV